MMNIGGKIVKKGRRKSIEAAHGDQGDSSSNASMQYDMSIELHNIEFISSGDDSPDTTPSIQFACSGLMSPMYVHANKKVDEKASKVAYEYAEKAIIYSVEPDSKGVFIVSCKAGKRKPPPPPRSPISIHRAPKSPRSDDDSLITILATAEISISKEEAFCESGAMKVFDLTIDDATAPGMRVVMKATFSLLNERVPTKTSVESLLPNLVHVTVIRAVDLKCTERGGADGVVVLKRGSWSASTRIIPDNNNPTWNQKFFVPMSKTPGKPCILLLKVKNHNLVKDEIIGEAQIDLLPYCHKARTTMEAFYATLSITSAGISGIGKKSETGSIQLKILPVQAGGEVDMKHYQQGVSDENIQYESELPDTSPQLVSVKSEEILASEVETIPDDEDPITAKEEADRIEKEKQDYEAELHRLEAIELKEGNYTVMVHIIEVADLPATDANGSSDPVVYVNCFDLVKHTRIKKSCTNAVFDDLFTFELEHMKKDDLEGGVIRVDVKDADAFGHSNEHIGSFQIDFGTIYYQSQTHEIYRQWVNLVDFQNSKSITAGGNHGRIFLSVTIVGPGEKPPVHDRKKELEEEAQRIAENLEAPIFKLVPPVQQDLHFLQVTIYRAKDIPPMDMNAIGTYTGIDAYFKIKFGDSRAARSSVVTTRSHSSDGGLLSITWNVRIMIPVMVPTMSNRIEIKLMDRDAVLDEIVGTCPIIDFRHVQRGTYKQPFWLPIYGATHPNKINYTRDITKRQATKPSEATFYRGSILMSMSEYSGKDKRMMKSKVRIQRLKGEQLPVKLPPMSQYILQALLYSGSDLPTRSPYAIPHISQDLTVKVCIGASYAAATTKKIGSNEKYPGVVRWDELLKVGGGPLDLPTDARDFPDIFIYLVREGEHICFYRLKPTDLLKQGFDGLPRWYHLNRDPALNQVPADKFPGSLLLRLGMGPVAKAAQAVLGWVPSSLPTLEPYTLFVHIYQARDLSPEDPSGLLDPFIIVRFNGIDVRTRTHKNTRNPNFFQTVRIESMLPVQHNLWPEISVEVWDWDIAPSSDDWVGTIRLSPSPTKIFRSEKTSDLYEPTPDYYCMNSLDGEPTQGEIMLDYEFILMESIDSPLPERPSIIPDMTDYIVEVVPLGLRDLRSKGLTLITNPYVSFKVGGAPLSRNTQPSKKPTTKDPNFKVEQIRIPCRMSTDPIFAPRLEITVYDKRLGGFSNVLLGRTSIDLEPHMFKKGDNPRYVSPGGVAFLGSGSSNPFLEEPIEMPENIEPSLKKPVSSPATEKRTKQTKDRRASGKQNLLFGKAMVQAKHMLDSLPEIEEPPKLKLKGTSTLVESAASSEQYLVGRMEYNEEMEWGLGPTPFEEYPIYKGTKHGKSFLSEAFARIGYFKGVVRVYEDVLQGGDQPEDYGLAHPLPLQISELSTDHAVQVRIYVLKACNIPAKDLDKNSSDPYIMVKLGKTVISDRHNHLKEQVKDVKFFKYFEITTKFPGSSKLEISIYDWEAIGPDNLIGTTIIDLEDRWFSRIWRSGELWKIEGDADGEFTSAQQAALDREINTPTEIRQLWNPTRSNPQGSLKLWVDVLPLSDVSKYPPINISPPPLKDYEMRIIIYKARNWLKPGDILTGMTDLFFKLKMENEDSWHSTDIHYRAEQAMSFNWRMKFNLKLPVDEDKAGQSDINLQVCDFDILFNDILYEKKVSLGEFYSRAHKADEPVQFFPADNSGKAVTFEQALIEFCHNHDEYMKQKQADVDDEAWGLNADVEAGELHKRTISQSVLSEHTSLVHRTSVLRQDYGTSDASFTARPKSLKKKISMWSRIKEGMGFGPDPAYSGWLLLENVGEVCIGIEILPKRLADKAPAGNGREAPNSNPELPEPEGRLDPMRMINPFYAMKTCMGTGMLVRLTGVLCFIAIVAVIIVFGPTLSGFVVVADTIPYGNYLFLLVIIVAVIGCCYSGLRLSKECGCGPSADEIDEMDKEEMMLPHMD